MNILKIYKWPKKLNLYEKISPYLSNMKPRLIAPFRLSSAFALPLHIPGPFWRKRDLYAPHRVNVGALRVEKRSQIS